MLCMAATMCADLAAGQANLTVISHQMKGDRLLADGGWVGTCTPEADPCDEHLGEGHADEDHQQYTAPGDMSPGGDHHHHHSDTVSAPLPAVRGMSMPLFWADMSLTPTKTPMLIGLIPTGIDQPPKLSGRLS
jgi:hypothetical protein